MDGRQTTDRDNKLESTHIVGACQDGGQYSDVLQSNQEGFYE